MSYQPLNTHETLLILGALRAFQETDATKSASTHLASMTNTTEIDALCERISSQGIAFIPPRAVVGPPTQGLGG